MMLNHLLICGLGSIGQRHLRHFRQLGVSRIDAWRTGMGTLALSAEPDRTYSSLDEALAAGPQAVIVANPTSMHVATARRAVDADCHVLSEKPLGDCLDGAAELVERAQRNGRVMAVGCNLRFHPLLLRARDLVSSGRLGRPLLARAHFGAWLPAWHPWEDYRTSYAARRELGGGAALTHIHEIDYLLWLFGPAEDACGHILLAGPLETNVEEVAVGVMKHTSGVLATVTLSLCEQPPSRTLHVAFEHGTISVDLVGGVMHLHDAVQGHSETCPAGVEMDATYGEQAQAFVRAVATGEPGPLCTGEDALEALRLALILRGSE